MQSKLFVFSHITMFRFKKFTINDEMSSMKVGTDAVLLGAWAWLPNAQNSDAKVLEVGCGCGVISLMLAQRAPAVRIYGIDIHKDSVVQALDNKDHSQFNNIDFFNLDYLSVLNNESPLPFGFDLKDSLSCIISNPPYHTETLLPPKEHRAMARNEKFLPFAEFVRISSAILKEGGHLQVVIPTLARDEFHRYSQQYNFTLSRVLLVKTIEQKGPRRILLDYIKCDISLQDTATNKFHEEKEIVLMDKSGMRSKAYSDLCAEYYL